MSTATIRAGFGAVEGEDFTTAVLGPVAEGRPETAVPVEAPVGEPVTIPVPPHSDIGTIEARVKRGALLLDATTPGWAARADGYSLDMWTCSRCLLARVYGDYATGRCALTLLRTDEAVACGFTLSDETTIEERATGSQSWSALADAWRIEIRSRRPEGRG
jgi:hypothetical protein